ncbi:ATP synthase [Prochlorococcus sp. MIT 1300]|uniref:ATP synthase n=1 Tax=Prochlorococcus sp. MIT 1300 TaxID=3096218 RepID=UPI002A75CE78|nr:ATP synthase [Prochlorococcus sp. MIT 1300]
MLVSQLLQNGTKPPKGGDVALQKSEDLINGVETTLNTDASNKGLTASLDEYGQLQLRFILATLVITSFAVAITAFVFDLRTAGSLLVGSLFGVLYLRLLARSIGRLARSSEKVGKVQLLVPVLLVIAASRLPELELLPALLGFLLYKPAMILQVLREN